MKNVKEVNRYLANLGLWNFKLHNLHWNIVGGQFKSVHEYLESVYDEAFEYYDEIAEHLKMQGEEPVVTAAEYLKIATLKEIPSKQFTIPEAIEILEADMKLMQKEALALREQADEEDNFGLVSILEDQLAYYAKQLWFIRAMEA